LILSQNKPKYGLKGPKIIETYKKKLKTLKQSIPEYTHMSDPKTKTEKITSKETEVKVAEKDIK